jgi:hypothetical protein
MRAQIFGTMRSFLRNNGLSIAMLGLFLVFWAGMIATGLHHHNEEHLAHGKPTISFRQWVVSGELWEATAENWESEFLQMAAFVAFTVFLKQKGSSQSKDPNGGKDEVDREPRPSKDAPGPIHRGGLALKLYSHSLVLALTGLFLFSFAMHALGGEKAFNEEQRAHGQATLTVAQYLVSSRFWWESLQNWQSEFLSVGVLVILSVFLREKGSPESKPVDAPHAETGE